METIETTTKRVGETAEKVVNTLENGLEKLTKQVKNAFSNSLESALLQGVSGANALTSALQKVQKQVKTTTTSAQKSLADFDQLQRLSADKVTTTTTQTTTTTTQQLSNQFLAAAEQLKAMAKSIGTEFYNSLSVAAKSLDLLSLQMEEVSLAGIMGIKYLWQGAMQPFMEYLRREFFAGIFAAFDSLKMKLPEALDAVAAGANSGFSLLQKSLHLSLSGLCANLERYLDVLSMTVHICLMDMNIRIAESLLDLQTIMHRGFQQASLSGMGALADLQGMLADTALAVRYGFVDAWKALWNTVPSVAKKGVNNTIDVLNGLLSAVADSVNKTVGLLGAFSGVPVLGETFESVPKVQAPRIPKLAQGAVLPANKPFLAVVGDQKHGTNIEAPLDTIKQALAEVMAEGGSGDINIHFTGDLAQLARVLKPEIDRENRRLGGSLIRRTM